jgi:hypothetical protein
VLRPAMATAVLIVLAAPANAQPCNPVIDGTYCAEQGGSGSRLPGARPQFAPIQNLGSDIVSAPDQPGTFGAITFRGNGTRCIGLLRRGGCN